MLSPDFPYITLDFPYLSCSSRSYHHQCNPEFPWHATAGLNFETIEVAIVAIVAETNINARYARSHFFGNHLVLHGDGEH
jgi:hypothetical protein